MTDTYTLTLTSEEHSLLIDAMIERRREMVRGRYSATSLCAWDARIETLEKINPEKTQ